MRCHHENKIRIDKPQRTHTYTHADTVELSTKAPSDRAVLTDAVMTRQTTHRNLSRQN